jgi:hypothetical protein
MKFCRRSIGFHGSVIGCSAAPPSPSLLKQSSESLVGRIAYADLLGFGLSEVGDRWQRLWLRGGYPRPYLARTDEESLRWRRDLIRTLEQDLPQLGITIAAGTIHRFWMMVAHYHAQIWNGAELVWSENLGKRVVKTPKGLRRGYRPSPCAARHPGRAGPRGTSKVGASFEGFALAGGGPRWARHVPSLDQDPGGGHLQGHD